MVRILIHWPISIFFPGLELMARTRSMTRAGQLLLLKLEPFSDQLSLSEFLLALLLSTECVKHAFFSFGHRYGGASRFQKAYGRLESLENNTEWSFLLADPLDIREFQVLPADIHVPSHSLTGLQSIPFSRGFFETLPDEITVSVLCLLPSKDVANLRLASRAVAMISTASLLFQTFWASRFGHGMELGFVHPVSMTKRRDWRSLYFKVKARLEHEPALKNRKRIWNSLQPVAELGKSYSRRGLYGIKDDLSELSHMNSPIDGPLLLTHSITATSVSKESKEQITFGCRQIERRMAIIPEFLLTHRVYPPCWTYRIFFWLLLMVEAILLGSNLFPQLSSAVGKYQPTVLATSTRATSYVRNSKLLGL